MIEINNDLDNKRGSPGISRRKPTPLGMWKQDKDKVVMFDK
jgi:hypothetical protein